MKRYIRTRIVSQEAAAPVFEPPGLLPQLRAVRGAFHQHWRQLFVPSILLGQAVSALGTGVVVGYIVGPGANPAAASYVFAGVALSMIWTQGVFRTGWSLANEQAWGTLDLLLATRTPIALILFGKTLAIITFGGISGAVALLAALTVAGAALSPREPALFLAASVTALIGVIATCFLFAPLAFLAGVRGGFFNALIPLGTVVSGFLYPVELLPLSLEALSLTVPTSWAMRAIVDSIDGEASSSAIALNLVVSLVLSMLLLVVSAWLFVRAERRVRVSGELGTV